MKLMLKKKDIKLGDKLALLTYSYGLYVRTKKYIEDLHEFHKYIDQYTRLLIHDVEEELLDLLDQLETIMKEVLLDMFIKGEIEFVPPENKKEEDDNNG